MPAAADLLYAALVAYGAENGGIDEGAAALLADLGEATNIGAVKHAARVARGERGGRPEHDDARLLDDVTIEFHGKARSLWHACGIVGKRHAKAGEGRAESIQRRLFGKASAAKIVLMKRDTSEIAAG